MEQFKLGREALERIDGPIASDDGLLIENVLIFAEREIESLRAELAELQANRDFAWKEFERACAAPDRLQEEKNRLQAENESLRGERDEARKERDHWYSQAKALFDRYDTAQPTAQGEEAL
jgi:chromosome segregation ATPase